MFRPHIKLGDASMYFCFHIVTLLKIFKAFLHVFLRTKKGADISGSDQEWKELADEVSKYTSLAGEDLDDNSDHFSNDGIAGGSGNNNNNNEPEDHKPVDTNLDKERQDANELLVDECELLAMQEELDEKDLELEPILIAKRREVCVLLSKVHDFILMSCKVLIKSTVGNIALKKSSKQQKISRCLEA